MKKIKRIVSSLLAVLTVLSVSALANAENAPFTDVKANAWYADEVATVYEAGIMEGKGEGKFAPNASMTRAELVTVLCRLTGDNAEGKAEKLAFTDTKKNAWYADSVAWAVESGIVAGYEDNTFKPNKAILRQELAKMFVAFLEYMSLPLEGTPLADSFKDSSAFPKWASQYIETLRKSGLMGGDNEGNFKPKADASRAEIATVITRLLPRMAENESGTHPEIFEKWTPVTIMEKLVPQEKFYADGGIIQWRLYVPDDYDHTKKYPVFIFLHGADALGNDNLAQLNNMAFGIFNQECTSMRDAICIYPQTMSIWKAETIHALIEHVASIYSTDSDRYYIMGLSYGGWGTWCTITEYPDYFAAAILICSSGYIQDVDLIADMPIYIIHGTNDRTVSVTASRDMFAVLKNAGSTSVVYDEIPEYDHDVWRYVLENEVYVNWLFEQRLSDRK